MQAHIGVDGRPDEFENGGIVALRQFGRGRCESALTDARLAAEHHGGNGQRARLGPLPTLAQPRELTVSSHERSHRRDGRVNKARSPRTRKGLMTSLLPGIAAVGNLSRSNAFLINGSTECDTATPPVGARARDLGSQRDGQPVRSHPDCCPGRPARGVSLSGRRPRGIESALRLIAEPSNVTGDVQPGLYRAVDVVFVCAGITENQGPDRLLSSTRRALVAVLATWRDEVTEPADQETVGFRLDPHRQVRGVDEVGRHDGQAADFATARWALRNRSSASALRWSTANTWSASAEATARSPRLMAATGGDRGGHRSNPRSEPTEVDAEKVKGTTLDSSEVGPALRLESGADRSAASPSPNKVSASPLGPSPLGLVVDGRVYSPAVSMLNKQQSPQPRALPAASASSKTRSGTGRRDSWPCPWR